MFTTTTLTLINFEALLDATVTVHQAIQNAAGSAVLTKTETMCIIHMVGYRMVGYRPIHSARAKFAIFQVRCFHRVWCSWAIWRV